MTSAGRFSSRSGCSSRTGGLAEAADDRLPGQVRAELEARAKYAGYIKRQEEEIERQRRNEETRLPADLDFATLNGLSHEVRQQLARGPAGHRRPGRDGFRA